MAIRKSTAQMPAEYVGVQDYNPIADGIVFHHQIARGVLQPGVAIADKTLLSSRVDRASRVDGWIYVRHAREYCRFFSYLDGCYI
jgi:hypothetical protein